MAGKVSRKKLAEHVVASLEEGVKTDEVVEQLASFLVVEKRTDELDLVLRAVYEELEDNGVVYADIKTATKLTSKLKESLAEVLKADKLHLNETIDASLIGGFELKTATRRMDASVKSKILQLREATK